MTSPVFCWTPGADVSDGAGSECEHFTRLGPGGTLDLASAPCEWHQTQLGPQMNLRASLLMSSRLQHLIQRGIQSGETLAHIWRSSGCSSTQLDRPDEGTLREAFSFKT
jgi:hypothetical protein